MIPTICGSSKSARHHLRTITGVIALYLLVIAPAAARTWTLGSTVAGVHFTLASSSGRYCVTWQRTKWRYLGTTAHLPIDIRRLHVQTPLGQGVELSWREAGLPTLFTAAVFPRRDVILFTARREQAGALFPLFTQAPRGLLHLSLSRHQFTPPQFTLAHTATPWVFFDRRLRTAVFAPASEILVSRLYGNGRTRLADGFNPGTRGAALAGAHATLMIFGRGIGHTIAAWGASYRALHGRRIVPQESTPILRSLGYWTDHGARYYYHYIARDGYAGTLQRAVAAFKAEHVPLGYLELDSWWYEKSHHFYNGQVAGPLNPHLPTNNRWNAFGGIWRYRAAPQLFAHGLAAFDRKVALPLVVHARWIAYHSPYRQRYHFSGIAPSSRAYWRSRARYLAHAGVRGVLQDWLVEIYRHSPLLHTHLTPGRNFTHGMGAALGARRIAVLYSMETSRFLMAAGAIPDVIAMRGGRDRFQRKRWRNFIYSSMFIHAVGAWPWSDVFMSRDRGDLLLSLLSGGPVGIGDGIGKLDTANIHWAIRRDGRLVKPAVPLMPTDRTILDDALGLKMPLVAMTHTGGRIPSTLVFVYRRRGDDSTLVLTPRSLGLPPGGTWIGMQYFTGRTQRFSARQPLQIHLVRRQWTYWIFAPVMHCGVAVIGDLRQAIPAARQRILQLRSIPGAPGGERLQVIFAGGERSVPLTFFSRRPPEVTSGGKRVPVAPFNPRAHLYRVILPASAAALRVRQHGKAVRIAQVRIVA